MSNGFYRHLAEQLEQVKAEGLYKQERIITSAQQAQIAVGGEQVLNFCANNYLGLANHPDLIAAAHQGLDSHGFGMASVRFICGTQDQHKALEQKLSAFLGTEDSILYSSCFDANGGLFETLFGAEDAIISDALNHASIIDGVRLCKARRYRYANNDMAELEAQLKQANADGARFKLIATDGVFSMDGVIADLKSICDLADKYDALVMVDDSHAVGFVGENDHGLEGLEMMLDDEIRGSKQTFRLQTDNHNIPVFSSALERILPNKERSVCLTLDSTIQYVAEKGLDGIMARSHPQGASIIVMNPKTGEILAMASRPTYCTPIPFGKPA